MKNYLFILVVGLSLALTSCSKECHLCLGGTEDGREICHDDGYGKLSTKAFKQNCKAGGGKSY